jgi:hypothetical protein
MKKAGDLPAPARPGKKKAGKKPGRKPTAKSAAPAAAPPKPSAQSGPVEPIDRLFEPADDTGGIGALKRLLDKVAQVERA